MPANAIKLDATDRTEFGKGSSRRARRAGQVPAVVYGHGTEPRHLLLEEHATRLALRGNENALIELNVDGESLLALAKDVQRHPIRPGVQHIDFLLVNRNEKVEVEVPVVVTGEPEPGTIHIIELAHVLVSAPAIAIPESIDVDLTGVEAGTAVRVSDLTLPDDVEAITEADTDVVNVSLEAVAVAEEETPAEAAEGAAPAEAE
ncbi:50S ribosomal protein L25/general stress protein Ctc [Actinomyces sp. Z5]|uniref:Large ribosomal subunit protein bL25 n=1 Tax=Actinomyces glycerinitolerans TaxID=1892869 RepID=A0A1M4RXK0_9ACTO|nr:MULTISPECIES: 50S ribosomal protein L25/general stress protein Ctc [Actinomyces]RAX19502.1 50S ribosomal protein L25/general stress protein Ctc [Actinomyces sp. Z5]SHE24688.1 ribosomal protein l25 [Actinomyces glycerinitolerans]